MSSLLYTPYLLQNTNNSKIDKEEQDKLFENLLNEKINGEPRFKHEKELYFLKEYYQKSPKLVLKLLQDKKLSDNKENNNEYRYSIIEIDSICYRTKDCSEEKVCEFLDFIDNNEKFKDLTKSGKITMLGQLRNFDISLLTKLYPGTLKKIIEDCNSFMPCILENLDSMATHPDKMENMVNNGFFELMDAGKISMDLSKISSHVHVSKEYLAAVKKFNEGTATIKTLPEGTELKDIDVEPNEAFIFDGKLCIAYDDKHCYPLKISKEKFEELFIKDFLDGIQQGNIGDCYFVSALDALMNSNTGRKNLYSLFEQDGNDILIQFPKSKYKIRFKDGELANVDTNMRGPKAFKMLEQAYMVHRKKHYIKDEKEIVIQDINLDNYKDEIIGGNTIDAVRDLTGYYSKESEPISEMFKDLFKTIYTRITGKKVVLKKLYIEKIKKYSDNKDCIVSISFENPNKKESNDRCESIILPEYDLYSEHAYFVKRYDQKRGMLYLRNPHDTRFEIEIPMSVVSRYIRECDVRTLTE